MSGNDENPSNVKPMNKWLKILYRNKSYSTRGHVQWTSYLLSMLNFVTIIYVLLGTQYPILYAFFPDILMFGIFFIGIYFVITNLIGRFDIKRGPMAVESTLSFINNPPFQELVATINRIEKKVNELAKNDKNNRGSL